jgi:MFS family permease
VTLMVRESPPPPARGVREQAGSAQGAAPSDPAAGSGDRPRGFLGFLVVLVLFTLGNASDAFLLLRARELGVAVALIPILWGALHVSKVVWNVVGGALADRLGARPSLMVGWAVYAVTYAGFALAGAAWQVWALMGLYGLYYGLTEPAEKTLVAALAPASARARSFGAYHFAIGIAALPASVLFGAVWQRWGADVAFFLGAALAAVAALLVPAVLRPSAPRPAD